MEKTLRPIISGAKNGGTLALRLSVIAITATRSIAVPTTWKQSICRKPYLQYVLHRPGCKLYKSNVTSQLWRWMGILIRCLLVWKSHTAYLISKSTSCWQELLRISSEYSSCGLAGSGISYSHSTIKCLQSIYNLIIITEQMLKTQISVVYIDTCVLGDVTAIGFWWLHFSKVLQCIVTKYLVPSL